MLNKILKTPVDELVEIVKSNQNCTITFLKNKLNLPLEIIERWLIILEEYNILKVSYKGFEGYVKFIELEENRTKEIDLDQLKSQFLLKAKIKNLSSEKIFNLWQIFLQQYMNEINLLFIKKAKQKGYDDKKIEVAWQMYKKELVKL